VGREIKKKRDLRMHRKREKRVDQLSGNKGERD
jgi:hypothetical protein